MPRTTNLVVVGIDLAGSPKRPTGMCVLENNCAHTQLAFADDEIMAVVEEADPDVVPIDAPLSLPPGRKTIHDRSGEHFRPCDRDLQKLGVRFFPITLGPMRMLTERGLALKAQLEERGYAAVECYPGAAQDQWGIPRQHKSMSGLRRGLQRMGLCGLRATASPHELDAASAALVGNHLLLGKAIMLGGEEGMMMPIAPEEG